MPRRPTQSDYKRLVERAYRQANRILLPLLRSEVDVDTWGERFSIYLEDRHIAAGYMGRRRGGDFSPFGEDDIEFGELIAEEQAKFLEQFIQDIKDGKPRYVNLDGSLRENAIKNRAKMYIQRLLGTANEAFAAPMQGTDQLDWVTQALESCEDCLRYERDSPFTPDSIPTYPGQGATACRVKCKCFIRRRRGNLKSFTAVE